MQKDGMLKLHHFANILFIVTYTKMVAFSVVCLFVCLSPCKQDCTKHTNPIFINGVVLAEEEPVQFWSISESQGGSTNLL